MPLYVTQGLIAANTALTGTTTIENAVISGITTVVGAQVVTTYALAAFEVNVERRLGTKTITQDETFTFSGTPSNSNQYFGLRITNSDASQHTITIPSSVSFNRGATITSFVIPATSTVELWWVYTGSVYNIANDPVTAAQVLTSLGGTSGTGAIVLVTGATLAGTKVGHPALATDDTYSGETIDGVNAGATIAQWEAVYLDGSGTWQLTDANGSGTYPCRGIAVEAGSAASPMKVLTLGRVRNDAWNWTPGGDIYLSATPGALTQTAPSTTGDKIQAIGFALTADVAWISVGAGIYLTAA